MLGVSFYCFYCPEKLLALCLEIFILYASFFFNSICFIITFALKLAIAAVTYDSVFLGRFSEFGHYIRFCFLHIENYDNRKNRKNRRVDWTWSLDLSGYFFLPLGMSELGSVWPELLGRLYPGNSGSLPCFSFAMEILGRSFCNIHATNVPLCKYTLIVLKPSNLTDVKSKSSYATCPIEIMGWQDGRQ